MNNLPVQKSPLISVVVPLFNEEEIIDELVERIFAACQQLGNDFEVVFVNDGSRDKTLDKLIRQSEAHPEIRVVDLLRNFGHMPALSAGLVAAKGAAVVTMDGDLQDPPELIPQFVEKWREGAEVVYGFRSARNESAKQVFLTNIFYSLFNRVSETNTPKQVGTFGLMDRQVVNSINSMPERSRFFAGLRAWVGGKQDFVTYERPDRAHGNSRVGFRGLLRLSRTAFISFSKVPLRYASIFSLTVSFILFIIGVWAILTKLLTDAAIPGWATFTTLIGFMGFAQSLVLAILAEYVAVIFDEVKQRPLFLVRTEYMKGLELTR